MQKKVIQINDIPKLLSRDPAAFKNFLVTFLLGREILNAKIFADKITQYFTELPAGDNKEEQTLLFINFLNKLTEVTDKNLRARILNRFLLNNNFHMQIFTGNNKLALHEAPVEAVQSRTISYQATPEQKFVFGAAPELIKTFLSNEEKVPNYIILPKETFKNGINFAEIEFTIYANYFMQDKQKVNIVCTPEQETRLREILQISIFGPDYVELMRQEKLTNNFACSPKSKIYQRLSRFNEILCVRDEKKQSITLDTLVTFHHFNSDGIATLITDDQKKFYIKQDFNKSDGVFNVFDEQKKFLAHIDLDLAEDHEIDCPARKAPLPNDEFGFTVLDSGDGFSKDKHTSSFVFWLEGTPVLVDPMPYSDLYLSKMGLDHNNIKYIYLSHCHGDHDQGVLNYILSGKRICLIGDEIVINQEIKKAALTMNRSEELVRNSIDIISIPLGQEVKLKGFNNIYVKTEYGLHSIPSTMLKIYYKDQKGQTIKGLGYSADTLYDPEKYQEYLKNNQLDKETVDTLLGFFQDKDLNDIIHEAGAGFIHTHHEKFFKDHPNKKIYWVHTSKKPDDVKNGIVVSAAEHYTIIPENKHKKITQYVKLLENVPLFRQLTAGELCDLAEKIIKEDNIQIVKFSPGQVILREGDAPSDNSFYIIAQGKVDLYKNNKYIGISLGFGQQLGEMAILDEKQHRRNATAKAPTPVVLVKVSFEAYRDYLAKIKKSYQKYRTIRDILDAPGSPFKELDQNIKDNVAERMSREEFMFRDRIITRGRNPKKLFCIIEGTAAAIILDKNKKPAIAFKIRPGAVIGEMSLLHDQSAMADVLAINEKVVVGTLSQDDFDELSILYPALREALTKTEREREETNKIHLGH